MKDILYSVAWDPD